MPLMGQIRGRWIDVGTYAMLSRTGKVMTTLDAGLFSVEVFTPRGELSYLEGIAFDHALVDFGQLVNQNLEIGETIDFLGTIEGDYAAEVAILDQHRRQIKAALGKLAAAANTWGRHNLKGNRLLAYTQQIDQLVQGQLSLQGWHDSMRLLLFGDRQPTPKFRKFQASLQPLEAALTSTVAQTAEYTLVFKTIDTLSYHSSLPQTVMTNDQVPIYREHLIAGKPMREQYQAEWQKYRQQAAAYHLR